MAGKSAGTCGTLKKPRGEERQFHEEKQNDTGKKIPFYCNNSAGGAFAGDQRIFCLEKIAEATGRDRISDDAGGDFSGVVD